MFVPPLSANPRLKQLTEARLEEEINAIYSAILDYNGRERPHAPAYEHSQFGWHVSLTLNGSANETYIYRTSCLRAELVFLCITYASTVCYNVHGEFVRRAGEITKQDIRPFFDRLYGAYLILRDVAKPQLAAWTTAPQVPTVAECTPHSINFLMSLCAAIYGICFCKLGRLREDKPTKVLWARLTMFVSERFSTCYTILQERIWPFYGRTHPSVGKFAAQLAGYALCYRTKSYAALLHDQDFIGVLQHRQIIALARCTEYLVAPLRVSMFTFAVDRAEVVLKDMDKIIQSHAALCEPPAIGLQRIEGERQYAELMSVVAHLIPASDNIMNQPPPKRVELRRFVVTPRHGAYNPLYHALPNAVDRESQARSTQRKPRFEFNGAK